MTRNTRPILAALLAICFARGLAAATTPADNSPDCAMSPAHVRIPIPASGMAFVDGDESSGPCDADQPGAWTPALANAFLVDAQFGIGSLRPWTVTVGLPSKSGGRPDRGFCLGTSTLGWRTLLQYERTPLPWVADLDADGASELLIWDSFPLKDDPAMMEHALVVWVYKPDADGAFLVDWGLSRKMASELAEAYKAPIPEARRYDDELRRKAAWDLEDFAQGRCRVAPAKNGE